MIRKITIENFKSIEKLDLELGRVNVLIGENGCGKTNILEAIAFAGAGTGGKIPGELLALRGIRATEPRFMRSAFRGNGSLKVIRVSGTGEPPVHFDFSIHADEGTTHPQWRVEDAQLQGVASLIENTFDPSRQGMVGASPEMTVKMLQLLKHGTLPEHGALSGFHIYAPENSALRFFQAEPSVFPVSVDGKGLYDYLKALSAGEHHARFAEIADRLALLDWFERLEIPKDLVVFERRIDIRDRYLAEGALFDQRSANEGFLFLLFYFTLLISPDTPAFFAIDNVDASLNPKLCAELMRQIVELTEDHKKQVILTTHNPALLDGLDLADDEQRLIVVSRNMDGHTRARRVGPPKPLDDDEPLQLSEAFARGFLGGLPKNF
jgi:energy-coupling factor transporter ATP-binding protein EcfA2